MGYGIYSTYYGAYERLYTNKTPSLKCNGELSKITSKIGLITADELIYAGYNFVGNATTATYLQENANDSWWSLSPESNLDGMIYMLGINYMNNNFLNFILSSQYNYSDNGVRPVISLTSSVSVTGEGTSENPYKVIL